jgi:hypothetical protein
VVGTQWRSGKSSSTLPFAAPSEADEMAVWMTTDFTSSCKRGHPPTLAFSAAGREVLTATIVEVKRVPFDSLRSFRALSPKVGSPSGEGKRGVVVRLRAPRYGETTFRGATASEKLAGSTGLEPAASGVTGRRSNQLNYDPVER